MNSLILFVLLKNKLFIKSISYLIMQNIYSYNKDTFMNTKMLTVAVTAALTLPITAHADIKFYGQLGAEIASVEYANGDENLIRGEMGNDLIFQSIDDDMDRQTLTLDRFGNILNDGPNLFGFDFDFDKTPGNTLTPYARYRTTFHTTSNNGVGPGLEAWAGLRTSTFSIRYGKLRSAYRDAKGLIDPWIYTSMQTRGSGGGLSAGRYNEVHWAWNADGGRSIVANRITGKVGIQPGRSIQTYGLVHNSDVNSMGEIAVKFGPISSRIQITGDDAADRQGGSAELKYSDSKLTAWLIGSYLDQGENQIAPGGAKWNNDKFENWKVGAQYKVMPTLKLALQYEDAELGAFDNNPDGGKYIIGSIDYRVIPNVSIAGWVAGYLSDIKDQYKLIDVNNEVLEEDVLSWSLGARYHFSKRSSIFVGYRQTDSDNDYRDENVFSGGILHKF
jgi:predicted porin